jgi:hypothetical protein
MYEIPIYMHEQDIPIRLSRSEAQNEKKTTLQYLVGGFSPPLLKNLSKSVGMIIPYIMIYATPLKNLKVSWDYPIYYGKIKFMFQTTNQNISKLVDFLIGKIRDRKSTNR